MYGHFVRNNTQMWKPETSSSVRLHGLFIGSGLLNEEPLGGTSPPAFLVSDCGFTELFETGGAEN